MKRECFGERRLLACRCRPLAGNIHCTRISEAAVAAWSQQAAETCRLAACAPQKSVIARRDHQHSRRVRYPERCAEESLGRCAAEGARKWRTDIGRDHLFGRLFRRHALAGGRRNVGRRIQKPAMVHDFANLFSVERLVFEQRGGDAIERARCAVRVSRAV